MKRLTSGFAFLPFVLSCLLTMQIFGQNEADPENWCRNGLFPRTGGDYKIAKIKGGKTEKIYFYEDIRDDCPANKNCRSKSYLIPNDEIIVSKTYENFVCGWFQPRKGSETVGWIPSENVEYVAEKSNFAVGAWLGEWNYYDNSIEIAESKTADFFDVTGSALWKGLGDNVHVGELEETVKPRADELKIGENAADEYDCKAAMRLIGRYLIVSDNLQCGGVNVTFSGVYQKKKTRQ